MVQRSERLEYIDFFRGIGIILMIMGHIGFGQVFDKWIHSFHMPMFFFVSGFFYKQNKSVIDNAKKNMKKLLLPYLAWGVFHYVIWSVLNLYNSYDVWYAPLKSLIWDNSEGLPIAGGIWFLTAMFLANSIYSVLDNTLKNKTALHIVIILLAVWGCVSSRVLPYELPWSINAAFVGMGFFHIARMINVKMKENVEKRFEIRTFVISVIVFFICSFLSLINGKVNMREGNYAVIPLFWIISLGITMSGIFICRQIEVTSNKYLVFSIISKIGKNSMVYLCLNQLFIMIFINIAKIISLPHIVFALLVLFMTVSMIYWIDHILGRTSLKIILGQ